MHIHKIHKQKHFNFLNQNRKDPITGDLIVEGDEIVFCKECKSAFLKDTWEYLGKTHCNSSETLIEFPVQRVLELRILKDVNSLLFPIRGSENEGFESFGNKLDDYFWKKIKIHLRIDAQNQRNIGKNASISVSDKYSIYFTLGFIVMFICLVTGIAIDFSITGCVFLIAIALGAVFLPLTFIEDYDTKDSPDYELFSIMNKRNALLHFKEDAILVYFDASKSAYSIDYTDITQIVLSAQTITICTKNAHQNTFRLGEISVEQIQSMVQLIYKLSSSTLLIFKKQPVIIKRLLKSLEAEYKSIWIE